MSNKSPVSYEYELYIFFHISLESSRDLSKGESLHSKIHVFMCLIISVRKLNILRARYKEFRESYYIVKKN